MTAIAECIPVLSFGAHKDPRSGACLMEMASFLTGLRWSDRPDCTHPVLASLAREANDGTDNDVRQMLLDLLPGLMGSAEGSDDPVLSVRLAAWCVQQVPPVFQDAREIASKAVEAALAWADCPCQPHRWAARAVGSRAMTAGHLMETESGGESEAGDEEWDASVGLAAAGWVAFAAAAGPACAPQRRTYLNKSIHTASQALAGEGFHTMLAGAVEEYDRLTGRSAHPEVDIEDLARLHDLIAA